MIFGVQTFLNWLTRTFYYQVPQGFPNDFQFTILTMLGMPLFVPTFLFLFFL
ncbi:MAG: hypothetical protein QG665_336 [Patescibacteria group bacterium]|nr:hypothetical protein [Patescibacteria group bacterium]